MLVSFEVENYGPFSEAVGFTTQSDNTKKEYLDKNTFLHNETRYNYVTYLFGYNGAGKSTLFKALISMKEILKLSPLVATNNQHILDSSHINYEVTGQRNFFKFNTANKNLPTKYKIEIKFDDVLYTYGFEVLDKKIVKEFLYKKRKRSELILERTSENFEDITLKSEMKFFESFKSTVKENVLCLSMAMFLNIPLAVNLYQAIDDITIVNMASVGGIKWTSEQLDDSDKDLLISFIKLADSTIESLNISLEKEEVNNRIKLGSDFESREFVIQNFKIDVESIHRVYEGDKVVDKETLPFLQFESNGTIKLLGILPAIFQALRTGGTLCVDEIENGLHPNLTKLLVGVFYNPNTNPLNAQLICTSHETALLRNIRRDQVWFLHKDDRGKSTIKRLSSFPGSRTNNDIAKLYLKGAFGEIPNI